MQFNMAAKLVMLGLLALSSAHPGHNEDFSDAEFIARRESAEISHRSLARCAEQLEASGFNARAAERRRATADRLRKSPDQQFRKRHYVERDEVSVQDTVHNHTGSGITLNTPESVLFASNGTCVLNPVSEYGPFWVKGEYVRSDIRDGQAGVPVVIDGQFIDAATCEPLTNIYWDVWNCNSTGVYSGVVTNNNGVGSDQSNINATFLRGIQKTDAEGVVQFSSIFPGHYSGRATHTHVLAHLDATVLPNNTITGGRVSYMGHLFWDQDLVYQVEATYPYTKNTAALTKNVNDNLFVRESAVTDPVFNYVYLGNSLADGLFAWITVAVNTSATYAEQYSFELTSHGGVAVNNGGGGPGGPGGPPAS